MKKIILTLFFVIMLITAIVMVFNIEVNTHQVIDGKKFLIKLPLYIKILDFLDRHYNYKLLANRIILDAKNEEEKVMRIFEWTNKNIRKVPEGYPVIDDHVWHIIVRGYGAEDQSSDVFTTLCNYAGMDAFYSNTRSNKDENQRMPFSFVKIAGRWIIFDPYNGIYFKNNRNCLANIKDIKANNWKIEGKKENSVVDYKSYFENLSTIEKIGFTRANIQSPLNRLFFEIKKKLKKI